MRGGGRVWSMNWSNRVVGGWWRNLKFGGWEVHYFEDGGWRMKVKNQNEILEYWNKKKIYLLR